MAICKLTISTVTDGKENKIERMGKIERFLDGFVLSYKEEGAQVVLTLQNGVAVVERTGDYGLRLPLVEGKTGTGTLTFGGGSGSLPFYARLVRWKEEGGAVEIALQYALDFGEERQEMALHILVKTRGDSI